METYIMHKSDIATEFICCRCKRKKKSKNIAINENGFKFLCNGCFGLMLAQHKIQRKLNNIS